MKISKSVQGSYSRQYDSLTDEWRQIAAKYKAKNIVELSRKISFTNVLEVGAGEGSILYWLSKWNFSSNLYGIEISESGIEQIKKKHIENLKEILLFDGYKIPYPDSYFDLIICSHVMEHVEFERPLLREIKRVSKYQIFEVPIDFSFQVDRNIKHFMSYGHINIYTPALFRFLLLSENFIVIKGKYHLYADEVLKYIYRNRNAGYLKVKIKHFILRLFPYLLRIKPNSYVVLTEKDENEISIF